MDINVYASGSTGNAYRVGDGKTSLLLDAGIPLKALQEACNYTLGQIDGCLITHAHKDHSKAAAGLAGMGIDIYTSSGTIEACGLAGHRINAVKALVQFSIGTFKILPFDVQHDAPEPLGFLIASSLTGEKLLYFTDTYYIKYRFAGLTHMMVECNYSEEAIRYSVEKGYIPVELVSRLLKSHMSLEHLLDMLKANDLKNVKQIYLLHLSQNNSNADKFKNEIQKETGAEVYIC